MISDYINYVPIDFIKAKVIGLTVEHFTENPRLKNPTSIFKGECLSKTIYKHENISITIFENNNRIEFSGSLHTFYNNGKHNYNDFGYNAFLIALSRLLNDFGIKPENLYILHLEWGYNIIPPMLTNYILDRMVQHNSVNKTAGMDCKIEGKYFQFKHSNYILKIYNKGLHFKLKKENMRIEIKQTNWSEYRLKGIVTLQDFINSNKKLFIKTLLNQWKRVILYNIDEAKESNYKHYQTSTYWDELRQTKSNVTFKKYFDRLEALNQLKGFNLKENILKLIIQKVNELQL